MDNKQQPPQYAQGQPVYAQPQPQPQPQPQQQQQGYYSPAQVQPDQQYQVVQQPAPVAQPVGQQAQQYQPAQPMQASRGVSGGPEWSNSLMDCSPCDSCCLGTFLPCILLGQTSDRMRDPTMASADTMNSDCMVMCAIQYITGCGWIYVMVKRSEIRERFNIKGDGMSDCCTSYWCSCCALIQQDKEVIARLGAPGVVTQGYQAQAGMQMPQK